MSDEVVWDENLVATTFVRQYYTRMHEDPSSVACFFDGKHAQFCYSDAAQAHSLKKASGEGIQALINELGFEGGVWIIKFVGAQKCPDEGVVILVDGLFRKESLERKFTQTIFLAKLSANKNRQ